MKLYFRIIFKILLIFTIFIGCATTEEIKETDPEVLLNQGIAFGKEGQYDRAIAYFNKALDINPRDAETYYNRGVAHDELGQYDKAIADYTKAIEINPNLAEAYNNRGIAHYEKGKYDMACSDWKRACELGFCESYELAKRKGDCK
jgi:Flp pilus assembly protein TadD